MFLPLRCFEPYFYTWRNILGQSRHSVVFSMQTCCPIAMKMLHYLNPTECQDFKSNHLFFCLNAQNVAWHASMQKKALCRVSTSTWFVLLRDKLLSCSVQTQQNCRWLYWGWQVNWRDWTSNNCKVIETFTFVQYLIFSDNIFLYLKNANIIFTTQQRSRGRVSKSAAHRFLFQQWFGLLDGFGFDSDLANLLKGKHVVGLNPS